VASLIQKLQDYRVGYSSRDRKIPKSKDIQFANRKKLKAKLKALCSLEVQVENE
jgi:hypothetical protein